MKSQRRRYAYKAAAACAPGARVIKNVVTFIVIFF